MLDSPFLTVLVTSPSFWQSAALPALAMLTLGAALAQTVRRRPLWSAFWRDDRGAAVAVDFVLTAPIALAVVLLMIQFLLLLQGNVFVHYAAYCAARSARVYAWDSDTPLARIGERIGLEHLIDTRALERRAAQAARYALIAASPAQAVPAAASDELPESALAAIAAASGGEVARDVYLHKARYAFDPANSTVHLRVDYGAGLGMLAGAIDLPAAWPIAAEVTFRYHLVIPFGRVFGTARGDGHYYYPMRAEVSLL